MGDFSGDDDAVIWWSSGSTGRNNGVAVIKSTQPESFLKTNIKRIFSILSKSNLRCVMCQSSKIPIHLSL